MQLFLDLFINYGVLAIIFIIGLIITIEDFKFGKIRNKWIKLGFILGLAFYFLSVIILLISGQSIIWQDYLMILLNTLIAFILGFALWHFKLWAGGDAKLFTLYVFLIPLFFYDNAYFKYWPALNLLINITLPIFIYLLIKFLLYPIQLGINYLKNPKLLKEYYQKFKAEKKIDKSKIKEYINTGLSLLLILIFFQVLRARFNEFLNPYFGQLATASYFLASVAIFKPLRALLQKKIILASIFVAFYFILGFIFFRQIVYGDLHKIFALQMVLMGSYFYIYKYGKDLGQFLYNSAEIKLVPVEALEPGVFINKNYIQGIMGSRTNLDEFKKELDPLLEETEKSELWQLIGRKTNKTMMEKQKYQLLSLYRYFRLNSLPSLIKQIYGYKKQRDLDKSLLAKISEKLNEQQKQKLEQIIHNTDEIKEFLKSIRGRLNAEQASQLKAMLKQRNEEISQQGYEPVKQLILHKTFSFAPWMLLGVVITLLTKSSLIHLIYQYILHR